MIFIHKFNVPYGETGYYFWEHKLQKNYKPGTYSIFGFGVNKGTLINLEDYYVSNIDFPSIMTKDSISLKISLMYQYEIKNVETVFQKFLKYSPYGNNYHIQSLSNELKNQLTVFLNKYFAGFTASQIAEDNSIVQNIDYQELNNTLKDFGVEILRLQIVQLTFPKKILDLFAKRLEANMRAVVDLENARTVIATARAMKNAASMLQDNDGTKFLYYLETMNKIATSGGKHTFHFSQNATKE